MSKTFQIESEIRRRRILIIPFGKGLRVVGAGVDILVAGWRHLTLEDLAPVWNARDPIQ